MRIRVSVTYIQRTAYKKEYFEVYPEDANLISNSLKYEKKTNFVTCEFFVWSTSLFIIIVILFENFLKSA